MARVMIEVTERHETSGYAGACSHCPVALAIRDALPGTDLHVAVYTCGEAPPKDTGGIVEILQTVEPHTNHRADLPEWVRRRVDHFDRGDSLGAPFTFDLDVPDELLEESDADR